MCPIGTVTFRLAARVPPSSPWPDANFDKILILLLITMTTCHDFHRQHMLTTVPLLLSMLMMGVSGLISTFHCVTRESIPRSVEVTTKSWSKAASKTGPSLCSSLKSTRQFLHLFDCRNKQTNRLQQLTVLRLCLQFVTILLCCQAAGSQA